MNLDGAWLILSLIPGGIGFVLVVYGKKLGRWPLRTKTFCGMSMFGGGASGMSNASMGGVTMDRLVSQMSSEMRGPAIDRTGLTGLFDILIEFASARGQLQAAAPDLTRDVAPPTFRDALQEQLGLRIQIEKGPLEVVVIDSIERPSDN